MRADCGVASGGVGMRVSIFARREWEGKCQSVAGLCCCRLSSCCPVNDQAGAPSGVRLSDGGDCQLPEPTGAAIPAWPVGGRHLTMATSAYAATACRPSHPSSLKTSRKVQHAIPTDPHQRFQVDSPLYHPPDAVPAGQPRPAVREWAAFPANRPRPWMWVS